MGQSFKIIELVFELILVSYKLKIGQIGPAVLKTKQNVTWI